MNTALSVSAYQEVSSHVPNADSEHEIWEPLDLLAEESAGLAKWRSFAVDGHVIPSYVFIGPRGGGVPIRLALLGRGIEREEDRVKQRFGRSLAGCQCSRKGGIEVQ